MLLQTSKEGENMKAYAEICKAFKHFYGMSIDEGKYCLACQQYWQTKATIRHSWKCEIPEQAKRRKMYFDSQKKGQQSLKEVTVRGNC